MEQLSPTLLCDFFALSLTLWNHSPVLRQHPQPDPQFIWNLAVEALQHDFVAPGLSTVSAVLLDLTGRPVSSVLGNTLNNARAVALAQTLGLHRNPSDWQRPDSEKSIRIRLWWAVLIHDRWYVFYSFHMHLHLAIANRERSSFAHGIPPTIAKNQYDVPLPVSENPGFVHLCTLSMILGDVLPLVYDLSIGSEIWRRIRRVEADLDQWEEKSSPGIGSSIRLGYLSIRLLVCRISLHQASASDQDTQRYHFSQLRRAANEIVDYICSLTKTHFNEFWLPCT